MKNWQDGDLKAALSIMNKMIAQGSLDLGALHLQRGSINKDLGDTTAALHDFKASSAIRPQSRLASACYYNMLVESGDFSAANTEGIRFLKVVEKRRQLSKDTQNYVETILSNLSET